MVNKEVMAGNKSLPSFHQPGDAATAMTERVAPQIRSSTRAVTAERYFYRPSKTRAVYCNGGARNSTGPALSLRDSVKTGMSGSSRIAGFPDSALTIRRQP